MVLTPLAAFAQDDQEWETFTSTDGKLTLSYPKGWFTDESEDFPFPHVFITNSESARDKMNSAEDVPPASGEVGLVVMVLPVEFLGMLGADLPDQPTLEDLTSAMGTMFAAPDEDQGEGDTSAEGDQATPEATTEGGDQAQATPEATTEGGDQAQATPEATTEGTEGTEGTPSAPTLGDYEELDLGDGNTAGFVSMADAESEGGIVVRDLGNGLILVASGLTFPQEFNDELRDTISQIVNSVEYTGTAGEIMSTMMAPSDTQTTTLDGETLINERCTTCHTRERIDAEDTDEAGWTAIVDRMISYGAVLSAEERDALIQYLVETH
jgi:hypothetical protein